MDLEKLQSLTAYELLQEEKLEGIGSTGYLLRHKKTGAKVALLDNGDDNKVFSITFRTTPQNSTGVAHIMEHSVLCGSREFPAKDPFVELAKGSMNTFLNAMTFPDKTMFPVASCNDQDFANLMHVYLDAVFYPNIYQYEEIFLQEGWHHQIEEEQEEITYNGVVYNEMKGAFSSPDGVLEREILNSLFPDTTYANESGGDPEVIPQLSYEEFLEFHRTYYHPSNSYIFLYGDMDFAERLTWMDEHYLSQFDRKEVASEVGLQKPFEQMHHIRRAYPIAQEEETEEKTYLAWNAVIGTSLDTRLSAAFSALEYVLLEAPGAPLKEALLDAQIGHDIMGSYDSGVYQPVFSVIAKEANETDRERFMEIIRETLEKVAAEGVDEEALRGVIHSMEFRFREADFGTEPKGLVYGIDMMSSWLYDEDKPFVYLKELDDYVYLKEMIGTGWYEQLIRDYLLSNTHTTLVELSPEQGLEAKREEKTRKVLAAYKESLTEEQLAQLVEKNQRLNAYQSEPSTQEELEKIPLLSREDLKKETSPLSNIESRIDDTPVVRHDFETNGIAYIQLLLDASALSQEDLPYLGILKTVLGYLNTENYSYSHLSNVINARCGGITMGVTNFEDHEDPSCVYGAFGVRIRTLEDEIPFCFEIVEEILFTSRFEDKRLKELLEKRRSRLYMALTESGSATVSNRCMAYFAPSSALGDAIDGVNFYRVIDRICSHFEEEVEGLKLRLAQVLNKVLRSNGLLVSLTGSEAMLGEIEAGVRHLKARLAQYEKEAGLETAASTTETTACTGANEKSDTDLTAACGETKENTEPDEEIKNAQLLDPRTRLGVIRPMKVEALGMLNEAFKTAAKIQYVGRCGDFRKAGFTYTGAMMVLRTILSYDYLWQEIRVRGGAYGCRGAASKSGEVVFASYRDPHLTRTIQVYENVPAYLRSFDAPERDMTKYVIGTISTVDTPLTPFLKGIRSLSGYLSMVTQEERQKTRDEILNCRIEDVRALAEPIEAALSQGYICVLGNEDKLEENRELFKSLERL